MKKTIMRFEAWVSFCNEWAKWNTTTNINTCAAPNGSRSEIEYEKTAGGRVPNAAMVHRDTFITPTLPLASWESVCEIAPGLHVRMLRFCAYLSQYIILLFILRMLPFCAYLSQHIISLFCARPTFQTRSMPFSFSCPSINLCMCLSFLNQSFPFSL